ncbi:MAG: TolC family protein, partial [Pseudomonadota bacterium]
MNALFALLLLIAGARGAPEVLTLAEALELAASQPDLCAAEARARAAQAAVTQARAELLPSVSGSAAWSRGTRNA